MPSFRNFRNISSYDAAGRQLGYIDTELAHRLCADDTHEWRCVSCGKAKGEGPCLVASNHLMAVFEIAAEVEEDDSDRKARHDSDCSLTERDMKRNVGITEDGPGDPPAGNQVRRARSRIRNWARASAANRAVTVVPRISIPVSTFYPVAGATD